MSKPSVKSCASILAVMIMAFSLTAAAAADRTAKSKVSPVYPELAKKMNINGVVKVEVTVAPNGRVTSVKAIGGHPLLIEASLAAAKQFKYEAAGEESKEIVEFHFNGAN